MSKTYYYCSVYYEVNSNNNLYGIECDKFTLTEDQCLWLTESKNKFSLSPCTRKEGVNVVCDPNDLRIWFFEKDINNSLNHPFGITYMVFAMIIYIASAIVTPLLCLSFSSDPGNFTTPLIILLSTAIGWPLLHLCRKCICGDNKKSQFKIQRIHESKLPHLQSNAKTNNVNQPSTVSTKIEMSGEIKTLMESNQ